MEALWIAVAAAYVILAALVAIAAGSRFFHPHGR